MAEEIMDPANIPVQVNIKIPWGFRKFLKERAKTEDVSFNQLVNTALERQFGRDFRAANRAGSQEGEQW